MKFRFLTNKNMGNKSGLLTVLAAATAITTGVPAETSNLNSATSVAVRESGIDFKSKIAEIDIKLVQIQTKISIIEQKNELSDQDFDSIDLLDIEFKKLTAEKLVIVDKQNGKKRETIVIKQSEGKELDKQLSIKSKEILERINNMKSSIDFLPGNNSYKEKIIALINSMNEAKDDKKIEKIEKQLIAYLQNP